MKAVLTSADASILLDENGSVSSLLIDGKELVSGQVPIFRLSLRDGDGNARLLDAFSAQVTVETPDELIYTGFDGADGLQVRVSLEARPDCFAWGISVENPGTLKTEWVDFPLVSVRQLEQGERAMVYPYNEGAYVDDLAVRERSIFPHQEPEYPSMGSYPMFPNMIFAQFQAYLYAGAEDSRTARGLYLGAHDPKRSVKAIDFYRNENGQDLLLTLRNFCGADRGEDYATGYDILWKPFRGGWEASAEIYREWFEANLPPKAVKIAENTALPDWYGDSPVVVSYPVRGVHDMDTMNPNRLFPYTNALPLIDEIAEAVGSRILVLLMHWEGTAPWAPPYVWPPYGGTENFCEFLQKLHEKGNLLGVYCSGFGYTMQSNLIADYCNRESYEANGYEDAMCAGPDGKVAISRICTGQRSGYDLCPASEKARAILEEAYRPLLESDLDYVQILDQNHGGSQYFCYSEHHGHPAGPGAWMTENMQALLGEWNGIAGKTLLGCESAAAEPFIGNLLYSDNRYELNWHIGRPIPLYAYIYHEYVRNFMGNQVCSPFPPEYDTLRYRIGYAFAAGDSVTLVCTPDGELMVNWGCHDFSRLPDKGKALAFVQNLCRFYREEAKPYLLDGRMVQPLPFDGGTVTYGCADRMAELPAVFSTAWEKDGKKVQIFVNPGEEDAVCVLQSSGGRQELTVPANGARMISIQ